MLIKPLRDPVAIHTGDIDAVLSSLIINGTQAIGLDMSGGTFATAGIKVGGANAIAIDVSGVTESTVGGNQLVLKLSARTAGPGVGFGSGFTISNVTGNQSENFNIIGRAADATIFGGAVDADSFRRFRIQADGLMRWGSGSAATDWSLERASSQEWNLTSNNAAIIRMSIDNANAGAGADTGLSFQSGGSSKWTIGNEGANDSFQISDAFDLSSVRFSMDTTNGFLGLGGEIAAETLIELTHATPTITGHVSIHSDADGSGAWILRGKREQSGGEETESGTMTFSHDGSGDDQLAKWVLGVNTGSGVADAITVDSNKVVTIPGIGDGGRTNYDLKIGDTTTPDYGMIQFGNAVVGRTSYKAGNIDLDGSILFQNIGGPVTSQVEFCFATSTGASTRFALAKPAIGNASYHSRSMLLAGPAPADTGYVTVAYWQTNNSIFHNLVCDTAGDGADFGVQNDLEVEGDIFTDSIKESTTDAGVTFSDDIFLANAEFFVFDKASSNGIKVDTATPTFGFADLLGDQFSRNTGGTKPTLAVYNGDIDAWQFSNGDEAYLSYHIPHDYVPGTDIHLHVHWSQNNAGATGGTIDFKYFAIYAKGHNQASGSTFTGTPVTATFSSIDINDGGAGLTQYQQHLTEVTISAATATAALFDRDDFEPDGVIELTLEMDANNLTGTPSDPFIHYADIHYQTTGLIGTKAKAPDFYA